MTVQNMPVRLGPAEETLIAQLEALGDKAGAERLREAGLPTRRVETFHYTDLKSLLRSVPELGTAAEGTEAPVLRIPGAFRILMVNGKPDISGTAPAGVIVGHAKGSALTTRDNVLTRLNESLVEESLTLDLASSVDPIIHVDHRIEGDAAHVADSTRIYVADGASATVVESFSGSAAEHLGNHASFVTLGKGASLTHILVDLSDSKVRHFATTEYEIGAEVNLRTLAVNAGADLSRTQVYARFTGEGSHSDFTGLTLAENTQHIDVTLEAYHDVPNTTSAELYKSVAKGRARAVFQGKLIVAPNAQKTDAKMMSQGLMLSDEAEIFSKPELEIFADDVVCGHGSTCGALDDEHLFYLMSRGIPRADAEAILVRAFVEELFDPIENEELHEALSSISESWLKRAIPEASI